MFRFRLAPCVVLFLALMAGCARNPNAPAKISGQVTYNGKAVPAGTIMFHSEEKGTYGAPLGPDGTYEILDVPKGTLVVTVDTESVKPDQKAPDYEGKGAKMYAERLAAEGKGEAAAKAPPQEYMKIPAKYASPKTSPLTLEVESGRQVKEFVLTD